MVRCFRLGTFLQESTHWINILCWNIDKQWGGTLDAEKIKIYGRTKKEVFYQLANEHQDKDVLRA